MGRLIITQMTVVLLVSLFLMTRVTTSNCNALPSVPNPVLVFSGQEFYEVNGKQFTRYRYTVDNLAAFPNELFAAAPELPPCGRNTSASRTWVDFYTQSGKRLYGFCALGNHNDLDKIWFAIESETIPPSWVYIELMDRKTNTKYKSNLAETCL